MRIRPSHLQTLRNPENADNAKRLRHEMTDAEGRLWYHLRAGRFQGWKFRRQTPIGNYIVDFVCEAARVIVELDGGQHVDAVARDNERTAWLEADGYTVIRFWNNDVLANTAGVLESLSPALSHASTGARGRGRTAR